MKETDLGRKIQVEASKAGARLFRNNVGEAWVGLAQVVERGKRVFLEEGDIVIRHKSRVVYGLCVGSGDHIGWKTITITPEMVGKKIAQFVSCEEKKKGGHTDKDRLEKQHNWRDAVNAAGGCAFITDNVEDAIQFLR
jgi:hypothetical protein